MGRFAIDIVGQRFGRLVVTAFVGGQGRAKAAIWLCRCGCGKDTFATGVRLRLRRHLSCGCLRDERRSAAVRQHGESAWHGKSATPEYSSWCAMVQRCENPNATGYENYGGRGISIHGPWRRSFVAFLTDLGRRPSAAHTLDRIDPDGNYEPDNVRWATDTEQGRNRRSVWLRDIDGRRIGIAAAAHHLAMPTSSLRKTLLLETA